MSDTVPPEALTHFDDHALAIARRQYFQPGDEDLSSMFRRVAEWVASPESAEARPGAERQFYDLMASKRFCPGGRVLAGAATSHGNVLNCFVQDGSPHPAGSNAWVLRLATKLALVTKVGGGNGLCLDPLPAKRPYHRTSGRLYLTIASTHPDYDKVKSGTYMDLVLGKYVERGYRNAVFAEADHLPAGLDAWQVGDSVESIWQHAGDLAMQLLRGEDVLLDLSGLRPEGTPVKGSGGSSSGPSSFAVEVFDNFATWATLGGADFAGPVATLRYIFAPTLRVIRQGGCLHPDTLVHTSRGTLRLRELVDPYQYGWQEHRLHVATDEGWRESPRGYNNAIAETLKVKLASGQEVQGTPNHKLKVMRETGERVWVPLSELRPGDWIIQILDQHTGAPVTLAPLADTHPNADDIHLPEFLTEQLAFFLGYLWGDGFIRGNRIGLAVCQDSPMMERAPRLFEELFGLEARLVQNPNDKRAVFSVDSATLVSWLNRNGLRKSKARELELPRAVRQAPRPVVGAFLQGLFEADGTITAGYPALSSASKQLMRDVMVMLGGLGIPTKLLHYEPLPGRFSKHEHYRLRVTTARGLARYLERVGVLKGSRLEALDARQPDTRQESSWPLPHAKALLQEAFDTLPVGAKGRPSQYTPVRKTLSRYLRGERQLTATSYELLRGDALVGDKFANFDFNEYYVRVEGVEVGGRILTLDLSVDENHTYLANGLVSHNTRRGAGMATMSITHPDIHDFITAKDLRREKDEGDISTFNISVLVTDEFMRQSQAEPMQGVLYDIAEHAHQTGEPGVIFIDRINQHNPMRASLGEIKATNPCVTADTWVSTHIGARRVRDLVGKRFCAVVNGKRYGLESDGFWSTGVKPVFRVRTERGFEVRLTANHRLKRITRQTHDDQESEWVEVADLAVGDRLALANHRGVASWSGAGTFSEGWLLGSLVGDGAFVDGATPRACLAFGGEGKDETARLAREALERLYGPQAALRVTEQERKIRLMSVELAELARRFGIVHGNKTITDEVEQASFVFYQGFLCGLFDADGAVQAHQQGASVRLSRSNPDLLRGVQRMLARLGIIATICEERRPEGDRSLPAGKGGTRESFCQADHELVIAGDNLPVFREIVDFEDPAKRQRLAQVLDPSRCRPDRERFSDRIAAIEADGEEEVYDVAVERVHEFDANGVAAHNCGEIPLFPGEPCDLGAMNLAQYVHTGDTGTDGFDWEAFRADVGTAIRFLDNVLEVNRFALPDNRDMSMRLRRLGLGIMGLADALIRMGYRYDSEEGRQAAAAIISELREAATRTSQELAEERGAFPEFEASALGTPRRNVALLTVAPTGTTSMLMGVSSGIEPVFAPFVYRKIGDSYAALIHPLFRELLERHAPPAAYRQAGAWDWDKVVEAVQDNHGSVQGLDFIPDDVKKVLVCAHDIAPADHVRMQGVVQASFDDGGQQVANSISKTINLPNEAAVTDVYDAYSLAFQTGCKGITVYRDGSREFQVLSTKASKNPSRTTEPTPPAAAQAPAARPLDTKLPGEPLFDRPPRLTGFTDNVKLTLATGERRSFFITVNKQYDLPIEVFISSGKSGDESNADSEALGRMVSIALQYGVPAEAVVKTLRGIDGGMYGSYQGRMVASKADLIAVALETAGVENVLQQGTACPDCGAPLRFEEGCRKCESCGYSRCG